MKKAILIALLISFTGSLFLTSCKKGEDDPFFSLYTRKMRVTGDWKLKSFERNTDVTNLTEWNTVTNFVIDGDNETVEVTTNMPDIDSVLNEQGKLVGDFTEYIFEKDGTFKSSLKYTIETQKTIFFGDNGEQVESEEDADSIYHKNIIQTIRIQREGIWDFLHGVGEDYQNRERIIIDEKQKEVHILNVEKISVTDYDGEEIHDPIIEQNQYNYYIEPTCEVWSLTKLSNTEMVGIRDLDLTYGIFPRDDGTFTLFHDVSIAGYGDESKSRTVEVKGNEKFIYVQ